MNIHTFLDQYTVTLGAALLGTRKFFSQSVTCPSFDEILNATMVKLPEISGTGLYEVTAQSPIGPLDPALYVAQWLGDTYPTLIYHHGNNERPFDFGRFSKNTFKTIVRGHMEQFQANIIVLRAPFHQSLRTYMTKATGLANFAAMLAASVQMVESLQRWMRAKSAERVIVSGISLGGWVTNMHRAYFNTADRYLPMMAGAALDEVFLSSAYRRMTGQLALNQPQTVRTALNFESAFMDVSADNVFPLLARYDAVIEYETQRRCYNEHTITVIDKGHTTGVLDSAGLRRFLLSSLE
jgi:hypothetical protein